MRACLAALLLWGCSSGGGDGGEAAAAGDAGAASSPEGGDGDGDAGEESAPGGADEGREAGEGEGEGERPPAIERPEPECDDDRGCPVREYCDALRQCSPRVADCGACDIDSACDNDGGACLDYESGGRFCAKLCISDFGCDPCYECRAVAGGAAGPKHCVPITGACEQACPCVTDDQCGEGQFCSDITHDCADGCVEDGQCDVGSGQVCDRARCKDPCAGPADCPEGTQCVDGHCDVPGGCLTSRDCEVRQYCDVESRLCVDGCQVDNDCGDAAFECKDDACVEKGCERHYECGHGQVCRPPACEAAPPEYCAECDPDADGACGGPPNLCANFQDEDGNDLGAFCLIACDAADPGGPCPQGYQCQEVEVQEGDVRQLCARACYRAPVGL